MFEEKVERVIKGRDILIGHGLHSSPNKDKNYSNTKEIKKTLI
jgi:hypothetical protein